MRNKRRLERERERREIERGIFILIKMNGERKRKKFLNAEMTEIQIKRLLNEKY